jgi:signal transduction histidine kinase
VANTAKEASRALGMGVDEVIRQGELSEDTLSATIMRARARASARSAYDLRRGLFQDDDELSLAALAAAFGLQLSQPLAAASLDCQLLESALSGLLDVADQLVEHTTRSPSTDRSHQLAVRRLAMPSSAELKEVVANLRGSLRQAAGVTSTLVSLAGKTSTEGASIRTLVTEIVNVMRPDLALWATVTLKIEGACAVSLAPLTVALILSNLLTNASEAVRASQRDAGRIDVSLTEEEDAVVLEVHDNGRGASSSNPSAFEPYFRIARANRTGLLRVRERLRRCGGDLMVDSDPSGTTVRVLLPSSAEDVLFDRHGDPRRALSKGGLD